MNAKIVFVQQGPFFDLYRVERKNASYGREYTARVFEGSRQQCLDYCAEQGLQIAP